MANINIPDNITSNCPCMDGQTDSPNNLGRKKVLNVCLNDKLQLAWGAMISQKAGTQLTEFDAIDGAIVLLFINRGKLSVKIDGKSFAASAGQALVILPDEKCVGSDPHASDLLCQWISFVVGNSRRRSKSDIIQVSRVTDVSDPGMVSELFRLLTEDYHKHYSSKQYAAFSSQGSQLLLLSLLSRLQFAESVETIACDALTVLAERARDYMRANSSKSFTISDLAEVLECSDGYLRTAFRHTYGYSPNKFLLNMRMDTARRHLIHSRMTINDVAAESGYTSPGYFARIFTRENGESPSHYRITHSRQYLTGGI